jgi:1-acyl-sn-glycerol-3-phosphate acyltransferase
MGWLRLLFRVPVLGIWTSLIYLSYLLTRPLGLVSRHAARASHHAIVGAWARGVARAMGMRIRVEGERPPAASLLVANHLGYIDVIVILASVDCVMLSKAEVKSWPIMGFLAAATGTLFVDRKLKADLPRVITQVEEHLNGGTGVTFFPEGTSSSGEALLPFKASLFQVAARGGFPVRVAALNYRTPPAAPPAHLSVCWWGDMTFLPHLLGMLRLPPFEATVKFGAVPVAADERKQLARLAQTAVEALFEPVVRPESV